MSAKERLTNTSFDSLDAMMQAYAAEAVRIAASEHRVKLDYSTTSIDALEGILITLGLPPPLLIDMDHERISGRPACHSYRRDRWLTHLSSAEDPPPSNPGRDGKS